MKFKILIVVLVLIVVIPIVVNLITKIPFPYDGDIVAGNEADWVAFWGTDASALLTSFVTLFVLWRESRINALNLMIQRQEVFVKELQHDLREHIDVFDFVYLGSISMCNDSEIYTMISLYLRELNEKHMRASQQYNSWCMIHDSNEDKEYNIAYEQCCIAYMGKINRLTMRLFSLQSGSMQLNDFRLWLNTFNKEVVQDKEMYLQPLADKSVVLMQNAKSKLNKMQENLTAWVPLYK